MLSEIAEKQRETEVGHLKVRKCNIFTGTCTKVWVPSCALLDPVG